MGKLIERFKKFKETQREKSVLRKAERGFRKEQGQKLRQIRLEEKAERFEERQEQITKIRKAQAERAKLEATILKAKAQQAKSKREISGVRKEQVRQQFQQIKTGFQQQRPVGAALMDFGPQPARVPTIKLKKKKQLQRKQFQRRQPPRKNIGLGTSFRVV